MIRQTRQRKVIREVLRTAGRPLTPQELYELANEQLPQLGLRTVYRQVKDLIEAGEVVGLDYPGQPVRYEVVTRRHVAHFICRKCNKLYSLPHEVADVPEPNEPRFQFEGQETVFYGTGQGLCDLCPVENPAK